MLIAENSKIQNDLEKKHSEKSILAGNISQAMINTEQKVIEIEHLTEENTKIVKDLLIKELEIVGLNDDVIIAENNLKEKVLEIEKLKEKKISLMEEKNEIESRMDNLTEEIKALNADKLINEDLKKKQNEMEKLKDEYSTIVEQNNIKSLEIEKLKNDFSLLEKQLQTKEQALMKQIEGNKNLELRLQDKDKELEKINYEKEEIEAKLSKINDGNEKQGELNKLENSQNMNDHLSASYAGMEKEVNAKEIEIHGLTEKLNFMESALKDKEDAIKKLEVNLRNSNEIENSKNNPRKDIKSEVTTINVSAFEHKTEMPRSLGFIDGNINARMGLNLDLSPKSNYISTQFISMSDRSPDLGSPSRPRDLLTRKLVRTNSRGSDITENGSPDKSDEGRSFTRRRGSLQGLLSPLSPDSRRLSETGRQLSQSREIIFNMPLVSSNVSRRNSLIAMASQEDISKIRSARVDPHEAKLVALIYSRSLNTGKLFRISVKVQDLDCFGDVVVQFNSCTLCLHVKNRPILSNNIDISQFLQLKSDFCLFKYYRTISDIKHEWNNEYGNFEDAIFVVCTNAKLLQGRESNADESFWKKILFSNGNHFRFSRETDADTFELFDNFSNLKQKLKDNSSNYKVSTQTELLSFIRKVWNSRAVTMPGIIELSKLQKDLDDIPDLSKNEEILSKLWFFSYQEKILDTAVKDEIVSMRKVSNVEELYPQFVKSIQEWFKNSNPCLTQMDSLFNEAIPSASDC
ncbi:hypothetical protein L9F63_010575 [Diploptera punctata]|uniref:Uncharacterized protein n=1 Tax=Diploptera punctata TaxID=6984 RepID=A0AAD8AHY9_DIPPU|nr:hypothetical protein L9F63_010575 [Diploptera punctata]